MDELVSLDGVGYSYDVAGRSRVLDSVRLGVRPGEVVAIVGESGCGKTTLGKIIVGLLRPRWGVIEFEGKELRSLRRAERRRWRRSVQVVQQDPYSSLNPGLTIGKTLSLGLKYYGIVSRRQVEVELFRLLQLVGLEASDEFLRRFPHQLSGGQRQRVAIARALSVQPKLIVADEVTSMLDVSMRVAILDLLLSVRETFGLACIFISHDLGVVRYVARDGRTCVMFFGSLVEVGPTEEVICSPRHPYTYLLLEAVPVPDPVKARLRRSNGVFTGLDGPPAAGGCVFSGRCAFVVERCRSEAPELMEISAGHWVRCFRPEAVPAVSTRERSWSRSVADVCEAGDAVGSGIANNIVGHPPGDSVSRE